MKLPASFFGLKMSSQFIGHFSFPLSWNSLHALVSYWRSMRITYCKDVFGLPQWLSSKESACNSGNSGDVGLISGSGRSFEGGHANSLQYFGLDSLMDRGACLVTGYQLQVTGYLSIGLWRVRHNWSDCACTHAHKDIVGNVLLKSFQSPACKAPQDQCSWSRNFLRCISLKAERNHIWGVWPLVLATRKHRVKYSQLQ